MVKTILPENERGQCVHCDLSPESHYTLVLNKDGDGDPVSFLVCRDHPISFREYNDCEGCGDALTHSYDGDCPKAGAA